MTSKSDQADRFFALYQGLDRSRGMWIPPQGKRPQRMETKKETVTAAHVLSHLSGETGLGIVPIRDDETCSWAAIDIDAHDDGDSIPLAPLHEKIAKFKLPLIVCQSKSQGAHLYLFLKSPAKAKEVRAVLRRWAAMLGHGGCEVFPKQDRLQPDQVGNWINLPYFNASDTVRFAFDGEKPLDLTGFLDLAESLQVEFKDVKAIQLPDDLTEAPPCVAHLLTQGIESGGRNNALFQVGVFYKKSGVADIEETLTALNHNKKVMEKPLTVKEVKTIAGSLSRNAYKYRCNEPPMCNICDKESCRTKKFGITGEPTKMFNEMLIGQLSRIKSDPPMFILEVNETPVRSLSLENLWDFSQLRKMIFGQVKVMVPPMKNEDWHLVLRKLNEDAVEIDAPDDASPNAMIQASLDEFLAKVWRRGSDNKIQIGERYSLLMGRTVVEVDKKNTNGYVVYFRGSDFIAHLKKKRTEEFKGAQLWNILRNIGCEYESLRIGRTVRDVWLKRFAEAPEDKYNIPKIESEI